MLKHVFFLLFLYGIKSASSIPQEQAVESPQLGIKKNEIGANGFDVNWEKVTRNFRNPVLEYLLKENAERTKGPPKGGIMREIRHSQTLLLPNFLGNPLTGGFVNRLPQFQSKPTEEVTRKPEEAAVDKFWNLLKNKTHVGEGKIQESVVSSPVLHLNKTQKEELTRIQMYPAVGLVINTFDKDGSLKSSVTHFQPDYNFFMHLNGAGLAGGNENHKKGNTGQQGNFLKGENVRQQTVSWPFANYFPIVINDPFMSFYNAFASSMYNAVSSVVEYGPEADICTKEKVSAAREKTTDRYRYETTQTADPNVFDEVTMRSESFRSPQRRFGRMRRDATSIYVKSREGDTVAVTLEEPKGPNTNDKISKGSDLILRKGGIAIAGPGGAATAYTGGTAIVGPYGTVYKSPEGTAILGPFSKVVHITDDTSFEEILRMHKEMQSQGDATGAVILPQSTNQENVGFKNYQNFFSYMTNLPVKFQVKPKGRSFVKTQQKILRLKEEGIVKAIEEIKKAEFRRIVQDTPHEEQGAKGNETTLVFRPKSKAEAGRNGVALSAPTSHAILYPGQKASIYFEPESVASAGPSGFAHSHSDLFVTYVRENGTATPSERGRRSLKAIFIKKLN